MGEATPGGEWDHGYTERVKQHRVFRTIKKLRLHSENVCPDVSSAPPPLGKMLVRGKKASSKMTAWAMGQIQGGGGRGAKRRP